MSGLIDIGPPAVEPLVAALKDPLPRVRGRATGCLGQIGDKRAVEPLINLLATDRYPRVRASAAGALGREVIRVIPNP